MTSDHMRRSVILLFIFNLILVFQNWESGRRAEKLEKCMSEIVSVVGDTQKKLVNSQADVVKALGEIKRKLDDIK